MTTPYGSYSLNNASSSTYPAAPAPGTPSQQPTTTQFTTVFDSNSLQSLPGTPTPAGRGRPRGGGGGVAASSASLLNGTGTGAKRGRKPRGGAPGGESPRFITSTFSATGGASPPPPNGTPLTFASTTSGVASANTSANANAQYPRVHWAMPAGSATTTGAASTSGSPEGAGSTVGDAGSTNAGGGEGRSASQVRGETPSASDNTAGTPLSYSPPNGQLSSAVIDPALTGAGGTVAGSAGVGAPVATTLTYTPTLGGGGGSGSRRGTPLPEGAGVLAGMVLPGSRGASMQPYGVGGPGGGVGGRDDEAEGDDELLPAMADDDYSAQLSWQSQSKDNLKVLMDNLSPAQYDRFEAYRRHALPKQAVRKVIQQTLGQQVSQPVAQIIAGFSKVFVGEIVEKARAVQTRRGETGPLSPDHLREAYRAYQEETGRVGAARPLRAKKLFVR